MAAPPPKEHPALMLKTLCYLVTLLMVVWLGGIVTITFHVAPSLFANESGLTPNGTLAGDVISPLLHKMFVTGWIAIPIMVALLLGVAKGCALRSARPVWTAIVLLGAAWTIDLVSGTVITAKIHEIRSELRAEYGGYHLAPKEDPRRGTFGAYHGISMMLAMLDLALGAGALFCVTQLIEPPPARDKD